MNHAIPGVNAGYIARHMLLEDHLRSQQQAISSVVLAALGDALPKVQRRSLCSEVILAKVGVEASNPFARSKFPSNIQSVMRSLQQGGLFAFELWCPDGVRRNRR